MATLTSSHFPPVTLCPSNIQPIHLRFTVVFKESRKLGWHFVLTEAPSDKVKGQLIKWAS